MSEDANVPGRKSSSLDLVYVVYVMYVDDEIFISFKGSERQHAVGVYLAHENPNSGGTNG